MAVRQQIGDKIKCGQCGKTFVFTNKMKQGRRYCKRDCYKEASRKFDSRAYPEVWHEGKKVLLHRLIWQQANPEIELLPGDIVHHIDEDPFNRHPNNLERITGEDARAQHFNKHGSNRHHAKTKLKESDIDFSEFGF